MAIVFVHPPTGAFTSGGNKFNHRIVQQAARNGYPLKSIAAAADCSAASLLQIHSRHHAETLVWDSLFLPALHRLIGSLTYRIRTGSLLVHSIPSMNPALPSEQRERMNIIETEVFARMDALIITGANLKPKLRRCFPFLPVVTAEPGIDPCFRIEAAPAERAPSQVPRILSIATLTESKGFGILLAMLAEFREIPWRWEIAGDTTLDRTYSDRFRKKIRSLGLQDRIRIHGAIPAEDVSTLIHNADFMVSASFYESCGMAVAEASAAGIPLLATRTGEASRFVQHGVSGFLVSPGDWGCFRTRLATLLTDSDLRQRMRGCAPVNSPADWEACFASFRTVERFHSRTPSTQIPGQKQ